MTSAKTSRPRVLVTWGSKRGGTEGIGRLIGETLSTHGFDVVTLAADEVRSVDDFAGVVVGGALYANRWPGSEVALLDLVLALFVLRSAAMFGSIFGFWVPLALVFASTWATGTG